MNKRSRHTFPKAEKLKSRKQIDVLFRKGNSFFAAPVKCFYIVRKSESHEVGKHESEIQNTNYEIRKKGEGIRVGFSVSKKQFKKAVDRNRIKRLMREAYRLHKHKLITQVTNKETGLEIFFVFTDKTLPAYGLIEEKIKYSLRRLGKILEGNI